ncbi:MAG: diaminopimelate decarboxylase [Nitrospinae bacterium RIFCSPLOWO2_02_FULL_39_110]|nr:MAG: diaminopimelate decarboxylase [Nitrospinae bacterium RIFCSPHIGHO2_02_39_11]OGV99200.1 MAG: diaminopimelate decarboxylase [Nitrospinae bacterium RIFCSPHIGHO2_12_FULL_39_42]OGW00860.1 MAG: diaminopimelate decarboxylase [Nitrospinae bacterium RIFCSPHIGHO2_02_FULL_39_82]OGW01482.1 MAG: diaminopimelate decarboxylase [Nitrospinae bacterium RIFCSPLOWO2_02_39_17]OGW05100.1 MAG: diaminopimelate decarboxylase [Nitrospinae bacterium RIFCSPLOWO2_02_FULL_39_110]OGW09452.1 MAG: diaminopimelate decar
MHDFQYKGDELYCEDVSVKKIAKEVGTPFYLYSYNTLKNHFRAFDSAFAGIPHLVCFAVKSNSNIALLKIFAEEGGGFDIVSGGELYRALLAGADPQKIVYAGVGKTREEIRYALKSNILMFNVESTQELFAIDEVAGEIGVKARVALRVNPDIDAKTHPYISTGLKTHKFGMSTKDALEGYRIARSLENIEVTGIHKHIGSQITQISPFMDALERIVALIDILKNENLNVRYLNIGGGLGITYKDESPPYPKELAAELSPVLKGIHCTIIFEPGRVIVGNAGILVTRVLYTKRSEGKTFLIVDAGMNDLVRPSFYGSYHSILPVDKNSNSHKIVADVVGPICESGDFLAKDRVLPELKKESLAAIMSAGAYGFTMSSNYNSRPRVPEILVRDKEFYIIRKRESYEDLVRGEEIPLF